MAKTSRRQQPSSPSSHSPHRVDHNPKKPERLTRKRSIVENLKTLLDRRLFAPSQINSRKHKNASSSSTVRHLHRRNISLPLPQSLTVNANRRNHRLAAIILPRKSASLERYRTGYGDVMWTILRSRLSPYYSDGDAPSVPLARSWVKQALFF